MRTHKILCLFLVFTILIVISAGCSSKDNADDGEFYHSAGIDANGFWEGIKALDYVEIFNYQAMSIPNEVHSITDDELQVEIDNLLANYPSQIMDRAVADGDLVNIDYVGSVDGVEFANGSTGGMGTDVTAGGADYIDDFLTQIIGYMPGDTVNVEVTFPDPYQNNTDLSGKDALFITTINYIVGEGLPELTDDFVRLNLSFDYGWATVDEMKEGIRNNLQKNAIQQYIQQYFTEQVNVKSVPDKLTTYQENSMMDYYEYYAAAYGMELDEFLSTYVGYSTEKELKEAAREDNKNSAALSLIFQAVAEDAGIMVSDEDVANYFLKYYGSSDYSSYVESHGLPYLKQIVLRQKVFDCIIEGAVFL